MKDKDRWRAVYGDGTEIDEDDGDRRRGWAEVDAARVAIIQLREEEEIVAACIIPPGAEPVLFRRRQIIIPVIIGEADEAPQEGTQSTTTVLGYRYPDGESAWLWRTPEGHVVLSAGELVVSE